MSERRKLHLYHNSFARMYFWRTTQQQEIDLVEERDGQLSAFEFKWNQHKKGRISATFLAAYSASEAKVDRSNFRSFLTL